MRGALRRLQEERAVAQLRERSGAMLRLGSEDGVPKLDWVEGVARLLENTTWPEEVEDEAAEIRQRGIRHIIWSGMGGSVMAVRVLLAMGFCRDAGASVAIHPLDSTDPAALNAIVRVLATARGLDLPADGETAGPELVRALLEEVMMIGVSMGMTSEEPITHLEWFTDLLAFAGMPAQRHCLVMTLPGSYLDRFAAERRFPSRPLQLDGGSGTGGRMSAPATRVFLLPAAFALQHEGAPWGRLRAVLRRAWGEYDIALAADSPEDHPYVQLAAALAETAIDGACRLSLDLDSEWSPLLPWVEQLMEESLGKGGKGILVFDGAPVDRQGWCFRSGGALRVHAGTETPPGDGGDFHLSLPAGGDTESRLAAVAAGSLGWQLTMALYGYLHDIPFAGQPAVEAYKSRARELRSAGDPLSAAGVSGSSLRDGPLTLLAPPGAEIPGRSVSAALAAMIEAGCPLYLDLTVNGEIPDGVAQELDHRLAALGNRLLGVPVKLRRAPAAYHSTEQSEMDGPPGLFSLRVLAREHETPLLGRYSAGFLEAQAVGTWQAMTEAGRACALLLLDGMLEEGLQALGRLLREVERELTRGRAER